MSELTGGRAVVELLKAEQVRHIFGIVGATFLDVLDALYDERGVEYLARPLADASEGRDPSVPHAHVAPIARQSRAIDDHAVLDDQVVLHAPLLSGHAGPVPACRWPYPTPDRWRGLSVILEVAIARALTHAGGPHRGVPEHYRAD